MFYIQHERWSFGVDLNGMGREIAAFNTACIFPFTLGRSGIWNCGALMALPQSWKDEDMMQYTSEVEDFQFVLLRFCLQVARLGTLTGSNCSFGDDCR
jgi:hypothetical protein